MGIREEELVSRLRDEWVDSAGDLISLDQEQAHVLKVPMRLILALRQQLRVAPPEQDEMRSADDVMQNSYDRKGRRARTPALMDEEEIEKEEEGRKVEEEERAAGALLVKGPEEEGAASGTPLDPQTAQQDRQLWWDDFIGNRRAPLARRFNFGSAYKVKVTGRRNISEYRLKEEEMSAELKQELTELRRFCTTQFYGQQDSPIAPVTAAKNEDHLRRALGWAVQELGVPAGEVRLRHLIPSASKDGVQISFKYLLFLSADRHVSSTTATFAIRSLIAAAKFLYHESSTPGATSRTYGDLEVVTGLRSMIKEVRRKGKVESRAAQQELKWLDWPQLLEVVQHLREECAGRDSRGCKRTAAAVAWSLQRFLIFAILTSVPDRQRTLRELEVGRTLFKEGERWLIRHRASDYKTGRVYGERAPLYLAPHLYPELEAFIHRWRAALQPKHDFLFSQRNGAPMTTQGLYKVFYTTSFRLTGKKTNPHLVRDSIVTYLRGSKTSERDLEALAMYMGHSVEEQRATYDRRTKAAKVGPAVELLESLLVGAISEEQSPSV
eukprot:jgi/Botrbrau1/1834/Bobra.146_1s0029.2